SEEGLVILTRLLDTPGPSGFESAAARVWREEASAFAVEVAGDVHGNSHAVINPAGAPTIMLAGHIDEIGLIITYIDDQGFIYVGPIGGWDVQVLVGQRIRFMGPAGDVFGVVGKKPIHLIKPDERKKAAELQDLWVDIGATSRDAAQLMLRVGDAGVIDTRVLQLPNNRIASRSIDDRIGAFVALEALRRYAAKPGAARVVAVATTQEEIGYLGGGALPGANRVDPAMAIAIDVTFATDSPGIDKKEVGECALGGGPVFARGSVISPVVFSLLVDAARRLHHPYAVRAVGRHTSTDADAIHIARSGVATALLGIPNRYMHSPNETVSLDDVDRAADVIAEACRAVTPTTDFSAR
ncbi:MAG: M20/M25/M40 family metallo-hydrolase, partial [Gemmatimonadaceae bacterium]